MLQKESPPTLEKGTALRAKKILTITDSFHAGGKERRLLELLKGLTARHIPCELIVLSKVVTYPELYDLDIKIHFIERKSRQDFTVLPQIYRIIRQARPDLVQSWSSMTSVYVFPITQWLNIPFVNAIIADAPQRVKPFSQPWVRRKLTFPFSDAIIGNSQAGLKAYHAPADRSHVMYNGFDFNRIGKLTPEAEMRQALNIQTDKVVGMVGKFEPRKDYQTYLEAAVQLVAQRPDVTFVAVGDGAMLEAYQQRIQEKSDHRILFTGHRKDVESIVNILDVGVLTTNHQIHGEGISNALMEYMALGKPVVATTGGGTAELVTDEVGFVIPPGNVALLAQKLNALLDDLAQARQMGEQGRRRIEEHFNLTRMTDEYVHLYETLLG